MSWFFHESDPMGGAAGEAYANTLKSPGMHPEHVLARESIQNSVDAQIEGEKVMVRFRHKLITGAAKEAFTESAGLSDIATRADQLELATPNCLATLGKSKTPLSLLYVEDHNAEGLSGDPHEKNSNSIGSCFRWAIAPRRAHRRAQAALTASASLCTRRAR